MYNLKVSDNSEIILKKIILHELYTPLICSSSSSTFWSERFLNIFSVSLRTVNKCMIIFFWKNNFCYFQGLQRAAGERAARTAAGCEDDLRVPRYTENPRGRSINRSINQSIIKSIYQSILCTLRSRGTSTKGQSIHQSINQSIDH